MPRRIEHKIENEVELKHCPKCNRWLTLDCFNTTGIARKTWDGLFYICRECEKERRNTDPKRKANEAWRAINRRVTEREEYISKGIEIRCSKVEFIEWYNANTFPGCTVDRQDNDGHYELSNIQMLTLEEHNYKTRTDNLKSLGVVEDEGYRYCYGCARLRPVDEFYRKKRKVSKINPLGLEERCKACCRSDRMNYYRRKQNAH